jgi:beta-phosphoglucomutase
MFSQLLCMLTRLGGRVCHPSAHRIVFCKGFFVSQLAVIFDMDGVLVDSYHAHFESWKQLYRELGVDYSEEAFAADFGRTSRDILRRSQGEGISDERIHELDQRKESIFRDIFRERFVAIDGAVELIDALTADGFLLAVGSSAPPENVSLSLELLRRASEMSTAVTGNDVTRGKPDPQVFQYAAERLGMPVSSCAVVEDAAHGVEAARRAGMTAIGLTGTTTREKLAHGDLVIDSLRELTPGRIRELIGRRRAAS